FRLTRLRTAQISITHVDHPLTQDRAAMTIRNRNVILLRQTIIAPEVAECSGKLLARGWRQLFVANPDSVDMNRRAFIQLVSFADPGRETGNPQRPDRVGKFAAEDHAAAHIDNRNI